VPKLTDFGLAKTLDCEVHNTRSGMVVGTPSYMAPEQTTTRGVIGPAADVYALGVLLYQLVTGRLPFLGGTPSEMLIQVATQEPPPPSRFVPRLPRDLDTIILKCLEKTPRRRYASAQALADDLGRFAAHEPIHARPVRNWERACRWACRRPALAGLIVAVALSLAGLLATWSVHARSERRHRKENEAVLVRAYRAAADRKWEEVPGLLATLHGKDFADEANELTARAQGFFTARRTFRHFEQARDDALFHALFEAALASGSQRGTQKEAIRQRVLHALAAVRASAHEGVEANPFFSADQTSTVRRGCYELLLVLAETVAGPLPHQTPEAQRTGAREALAILDGARRLGFQTHVYHLRRARYLEQAGQAQAARRERTLAQQHPPTTYLDHFLTGSEHFRQGNLRDAEVSFFRGLHLEHRQFWAHFSLALCHVQDKKFQAARSALTACLDMNRSVWVYLLRGIVLGQLKMYREADADFAAALALLKDRPDPGALYALHNNRAVARLDSRDYAGAEEDLGRAIAIQPEGFHAYFTLAHVHRAQKDLPKALAALDRGLREARKRFDAGKLDTANLLLLHRQRVEVHHERGDSAAVLSELQTILALPGLTERDRAETQRQRGQLLFLAGKHDDALAAYDAVLAAAPDDADALRRRAELLLAQKRSADAVAAFDRYLARGGKPLARIYRGRALARVQLKQHQAAIGDFTLALALEPADRDLRLERGRAYLACRSWKEAAADFDEVLLRDPTQTEGYRGRALARLHQGQVREAAEDADRLAERASRDANLVFASACLLAQAAGQTVAARAVARGERQRLQERAVVLLRRALELVPVADRAAFWRNKVQPEPALRPVWLLPELTHLQRRYGPPL
jgi:tetratricopeptide (TPR) repeat protein